MKKRNNKVRDFEELEIKRLQADLKKAEDQKKENEKNQKQENEKNQKIDKECQNSQELENSQKSGYSCVIF
jgi:hypothetical protein